MPFTLFHLGPALFFGLLLFRRLNFPTFLVANVIIDLEPLIVLVLGLNRPVHGFFHSFLGGAVAAVVLSIVMMKLDKKIQILMTALKLGQPSSAKSIGLASFAGIYLHILFDAPLYSDIRPFYPFGVNPFFGLAGAREVYLTGVLLFIFGIVLFALRYSEKNSV